jgi:KR domain
MEARGAKVSIFSVDICQRDQVDALIHKINTTLPPLRGLMHGGVVIDDYIAVATDMSKYFRVADIKVLLHIDGKTQEIFET